MPLKMLSKLFGKKKKGSQDISQPPAAVPVKSLDELRHEAREELGLNDGVKHVAVAGNAGVGKSSMINAIRGLPSSDPNAAPVGVTETTSVLTKYSHPTLPNLALWDAPGAGTAASPADEFFKTNKLYAFDVLVLVFGNRITESDVAIGKNALEAKIPVILVRSKSDVDLLSDSESNEKEVAELKTEYREKIAQYFKDDLPAELNGQDVFVVSARAFGASETYDCYKLDEERLMERMKSLGINEKLQPQSNTE